MSGFSFDEVKDTKASLGSGARKLVDRGDYNVLITKSDTADNSKGTGKNVAMEYNILDGDFSGTDLKEWLAVVNSSETAQGIAREKIKALFDVTEVRTGSDDLVGHTIRVRIDHEANEWTNKNTGKTMKGHNAVITHYMTPDGKNAAGDLVPAFTGQPKSPETTANEGTANSSSSGSSGEIKSSGKADLDDEIPF